jgi:hypothetical protein
LAAIFESASDQQQIRLGLSTGALSSPAPLMHNASARGDHVAKIRGRGWELLARSLDQSSIDRKTRTSFVAPRALSSHESDLEVLRQKLAETEYWRLRVLIHTHDTCKVRRSAARRSRHPKSCIAGAGVVSQFL